MKVIDNLELDGEIINEMYPELIGKLMSPQEVEFDWNRPEYALVANQFVQHMESKGMDPEIIENGLLFWHHYSEKFLPKITKPSTYAAALDYFMHQSSAGTNHVTQADLAREYDVSAATISSHYQKFTYEFNLVTLHSAQEDSTETRNSLGMEKEMRDLQRMISEQAFESEEDIDAFFQEIMESGLIPDMSNDSVEDQADDLLYKAQAKDGKARKKLINQALELDPKNVDGYVMLSQMERDPNRVHDLLIQAVAIGEKNLGLHFMKENRGRFWGIIETRPLMRAKFSLAYFYEKAGQEEDAIAIYEELLILNENDNMGIRTVLLPIYIYLEMFDAALKLIKKFAEFDQTDFLFSHALVEFRKNGLTKNAQRLLAKAVKQNPYVSDFLTGKKEVLNDEINSIQLGGESEAIVYAQENYHLWHGAKALLDTVK